MIIVIFTRNPEVRSQISEYLSPRLTSDLWLPTSDF
jgi:hypothetical protein